MVVTKCCECGAALGSFPPPLTGGLIGPPLNGTPSHNEVGSPYKLGNPPSACAVVQVV